MEEKVSVILVNYNGKAYNDKCIASILNSTIKESIHIVVVDNASTDDSLSRLWREWGNNGQVSIIELDRNYGFSKANNEGIRWSMTNGIKRFLLLNNDTEIEPDTIEKMAFAQQQKGGIIVPKVLYADRPEVLWCAGGEFSACVKKPVQRGMNQEDEGQFDREGLCEFANGCCLLLSAPIIEKTGLLDEKFFLYYEDTEYSLRAKESGVLIWYCPKAVVYHKVNGSTKGNQRPDNAYYITRNWLLCSRMHMRGWRYGLFLLYFLLNRGAWIGIWMIQGKFAMAGAVLEGFRDFRLGKMGKWRGLEDESSNSCRRTEKHNQQ